VEVETLTSASSSCVVEKEWRLGVQMDDAVEELKALSDGGPSAMKDLLGSSAAEKRRLPVEVAHLRGLTGGSLGAAVSCLAVRGSRGEASAGPLDVGGEAEVDVNGRGDACFIAGA